jgi:hypothetical protein
MSGTIWGVRELDIRYKPLRPLMPVSYHVGNPCEGGAYYSFREAGVL